MRKVNAFGIDRSTSSRIIRRVTQAISKILATKKIQLPTTEEGVNNPMKNFYEQHGFPQCLGAIDGTHIRIKQPSCSTRSDYINRKGNFAIDCQAAADYKYCFFDVIILSPSPRVTVENERSLPICLLGDTAYPLLPFIMKEFANGGRISEE